MGLKFRRGTTAQKSGSLAFGEPYVNTDLGTLQIGGASGDITLGASGTGSAGSFSGISGSSIDITGNAKIDGNLILGGAITIGDNSSDTVNVVASLSSSLIPSETNTFDLGSINYFWRDLYISTGSIKLVSNGVVVSTLSNTGNGMIMDQGLTTKGDSSFGTSSAALTSVTGSFRVSGSASVIGALSASTITGIGNVSLYSSSVASRLVAAESFSSSLDSTFATDASVTIVSASAWGAFQSASSYSGSLATTISASKAEYTSFSASAAVIDNGQDVLIASLRTNILSASVYTTFSTSVDSRITTETGRVDAILSASSADKDSFAEIVQLINSVDLTNDTSFASFYTASNGRLNSLESATGSYAISSSVASATATSISTLSGSVKAVTDTFATSASVASATATSITSLSSSVKVVTDTLAVSASVAASISGSGATVTTISASQFTRDANQDTLINTISSSLNIVSQSAYSYAITYSTDWANIRTISASAWGAFQSASSYSASAATDLSSSNAARVALSASIAASGFAVSSSVKAVTDTFATSASVASATATSISTISGSVKTVTDAISGRVTTLEGKDISITLTGDVTGTGTITDLANVSFATTIAANSVALSTDTTGDYVATMTAGAGITVGTATGEGSTPVITNTGVTSITGTTSQVIASAGTGGVTLSLPQSIATTSAVSFASVSATGDIVAYSGSDKRLKNNIINISDAVTKVRKLNGVTWKWNDDVNEVTKTAPTTGLIAQEVQEVLPEVVNEREDGYLGIDYSKMVGLLVEAIKEQQNQIDSLTIEIENLKKNNSL